MAVSTIYNIICMYIMGRYARLFCKTTYYVNIFNPPGVHNNNNNNERSIFPWYTVHNHFYQSDFPKGLRSARSENK